MKPFFFIAIFLINGLILAQPKAAEITLIDGSTYRGFADITQKELVEFRMEMTDEPETFDGFDIKRVYFVTAPYNTFEFVFIRSDYRLLHVISQGEITAYAQYPQRLSPNRDEPKIKRHEKRGVEKYIDNTGNFTPASAIYGLLDKNTRFWVRKNGADFADNMKPAFRTKAKVLFANCPGLLKKIKLREWEYEDMKDIVDYYNDFCSEL